MAVQAVEAQIHSLQARIDQPSGDEGMPEQEDLPFGHVRATDGLRLAYGNTQLWGRGQGGSNLPSCGMLVSRR